MRRSCMCLQRGWLGRLPRSDETLDPPLELEVGLDGASPRSRMGPHQPLLPVLRRNVERRRHSQFRTWRPKRMLTTDAAIPRSSDAVAAPLVPSWCPPSGAIGALLSRPLGRRVPSLRWDWGCSGGCAAGTTGALLLVGVGLRWWLRRAWWLRRTWLLLHLHLLRDPLRMTSLSRTVLGTSAGTRGGLSHTLLAW